MLMPLNTGFYEWSGKCVLCSGSSGGYIFGIVSLRLLNLCACSASPNWHSRFRALSSCLASASALPCFSLRLMRFVMPDDQFSAEGLAINLDG
jgi:hypothetical protein